VDTWWSTYVHHGNPLCTDLINQSSGFGLWSHKGYSCFGNKKYKQTFFKMYVKTEISI